MRDVSGSRPAGFKRGWLWGLALLTALGGCFHLPAQAPENQMVQPSLSERALAEQRMRRRPPTDTSRNLYEGSLWRGAASWGNLLRDHRARYRGDLLTVTELSKIINVPESNEEEEQAQAQPLGEETDPILAYLREEARRQERIDDEENAILRSVETIEVEVVRVLRNGNMLVRGVHPPILRNRGRVKYVVSLRGVVRPSDVDENNRINATRLSKADYNVRRLVRRDLIDNQPRQRLRRRGAGF